MSQHDLIIANQGFPAFRADLNDALAALGSTNLGATAPATTYAGQVWVDSSVANKLTFKVRNSANSAWTTIYTVDTSTNKVQFADAVLQIIGSSTGYTTLDSLNSSATNYTLYAPAANSYIPIASYTYTISGPTAARTFTFPDVNATVGCLGVDQTWTGAQRGAITALTDGATVTPDFGTTNNFSLTIGGNRTLANPSNLTAGQSGVIVITQDGTGGRSLAFGSYWKFASGTAPSLTTTASAVDVLAYYVESSTRITARLIGDVK